MVESGMDGGRYLIRRLAIAAALAAALTAGTASADEDPAASLYRPGIVNVIKLELPPSSIEGLNKTDEYQPAIFSMAETDGTPAGIGEYSEPIDAQIRLKGTGSFQTLAGKAAFKLKFGKTAPFRGLRKMTLNNMVQDPSMIHEAVAYRVFHTLGVPASRTSYAEVWLNGVNYGLHANVETLDKVSLGKRFGAFQEPPQHLYEAAAFHDVEPESIMAFEVDEGDEEDRSDLEALVAASLESEGDWSENVDPQANLLEMTRMWMGERYVGQFDGYAGPGGAIWRPNNFYLYSDPAGRFRMFPWSLDWILEDPLPFAETGAKLMDGCFKDASCLAMYRAAGREALMKIPSLELDTMARCLALRLQPWQNREPPQVKQDSAQEIADAVLATRKFLAARPESLATYLGLAVPEAPPAAPCAPYGSESPESLDEPPAEEGGEEEEGEEEEGGEEEGGGEEEEGGGSGPEGEEGTEAEERPTPVVLPAPTALPPLFPLPLPEKESISTLRIVRVQLGRRGLVVRVKAPVSGRLRLHVRRSKSVCTARRHVEKGVTAVVCRLPGGWLKSLRTNGGRLTLDAVLRADGGIKLNCRKTLTLPPG
jgi:CotH kinase protein